MKQKFKDHKATFTDYGNIKILDFKKPNSTEYLEDGWRMRCYPKEHWIKVDKQKCLEEIANCVNKVTTNTVVEVVEIVNNADTLVMGVLLKEFSKKSLLRYDKEHTRVTIDGWRINDWDHSLRVAIEKYL